MDPSDPRRSSWLAVAGSGLHAIAAEAGRRAEADALSVRAALSRASGASARSGAGTYFEAPRIRELFPLAQVREADGAGSPTTRPWR